MREHNFFQARKKRFSVLPSKCSGQSGDFNNFVSKEQKNLFPKKWNNACLNNDHKDQQIAGSHAKAPKRLAGQISGTESGDSAVKEYSLKSLKRKCSSSEVPLCEDPVTPLQAAKKTKLCGGKETSSPVSINHLVHQDSASVPPKKPPKGQESKDEILLPRRCRQRPGKRLSGLLKQPCSGGLWLLKSCDLLNIGRVPLFMMQRKLFQIAACGKLQSEKLRAQKPSYRLLDFNWMWFQKGFWNCCKKTLRSRIRRVVSYLKLKLQRHKRAGRRSYDMNNNTSGILYQIPQCPTRSCLRGDAAVKLPSVEAPFGNAASNVALLKDNQQALLCAPAPWCATDTLTKKASEAPAINNQPHDFLLTEKEVYISCQEETATHGEKDDDQIPLPNDKLHECASDAAFTCQDNASQDVVGNGDESCTMDLDDSTDSDIFSAKLLDHPYCKSPNEQTTSEGLDVQGLQNGQKMLYVPDEQVASSIFDLLNEVVKKYGSLIPLTENEVLTRLKEVFNQDFSHRIPLICKEMAKFRAKNCGFRICYNKHTLYLDDLVTLDEQQWLNDQVINMYGDLIMDTAPDKIHFFNTFFHKQLVTKGYDGVKRWTKKVDLFKKTLLLIPIHLQVHWALVAVNIPNKTISFYDSQGLHLKFCTENILKYLMTEAKEKNHPEFLQCWQTTVKKCIPQQKNDFDCGVFLLQYCKCLAQEKPFQFSQDDMPRIRKMIYKELCECRLLD
ncbi:sentrin-specific protease 5 [Dendrobates tinctorius]|uniref:sentrin-specific protease 5 n=1 Tax=Dendrobates tinctorius TaxID=92724 RepID=UPI003CCA2A8F